jgi:hypothetical protein
MTLRRVATWAAALVVGLAAVVGLIAVLNSRDKSDLAQGSSATAGPGKPYRGEPVLSPALEDAVKRGNVVVLYRDDRPPPGTLQLVPPGGPALEAAGQSVVLEREPTLTTALAALSAKRIQTADAPAQLQPFIDYWLGGR